MAEKIIIDIELKGIGDAQKGLDDLTKLQITQQDAIKKTQQEIKDYEKSLKDLSNAQKRREDFNRNRHSFAESNGAKLTSHKGFFSGAKG